MKVLLRTKTQINEGGAKRRLHLFGFYLGHLAKTMSGSAK